MKKKGSVTMFFSLFMAVFLILVQVMFQSVQIAGGRIQAESGVEEGLYSVFAGYDRELFERYHVFFLDGGYGTGTLQPGRMYQIVEESLMKSCFPGNKLTGIRGENLWKCSKEPGAIIGYTLATDQSGQAFKTQAVDYMKETASIQGIQLLLKKNKAQEELTKNLEKEGSREQAKEAQKAYENARKEAEQQRKEQQQTGEQEGQPSTGEIQTPVPPDFVNPLEVIKQLQNRGILSIVLPSDTQISQAGMEEGNSWTKRECQRGMGTLAFTEDPDTVWNNLIFQEYMMQHLDCYGQQKVPVAASVNRLSYQLEYVIAGKNTDVENLKAVANRLLALREAANLAYLMKSPASQAQVHEMALIISSAIGLPALEGVVSLALQAAWAFGESVLDVRQLLQGGKIPLVKTVNTWNLSLENLSRLPQMFQQKQELREEGISYQEYLRILLSAVKPEKELARTMDAIEQTMRTIAGKQNFRMDLCVSYLQVEMGVSCAGQRFSIRRDYGYEM